MLASTRRSRQWLCSIIEDEDAESQRHHNEESIPLCIVKQRMVKPLSTAELAVLAAGPPTQRLHDFLAWKKERNQYDGLVRRQRKLAAQTVEPPEPLRRSSRFELKKLFVSDGWLAKEHPTLLGRVEAGTPVASPRHVRRRIAATTRTPGGSEHVEAEVVAYTNPQPEESASERRRRSDRARR